MEIRLQVERMMNESPETAPDAVTFFGIEELEKVNADLMEIFVNGEAPEEAAKTIDALIELGALTEERDRDGKLVYRPTEKGRVAAARMAQLMEHVAEMARECEFD